MRLVFIFATILLIAGCAGPRVMKAKYSSKLYDDYFVLKNKRYSYYTKLIFNLPRSYGRYAISNDTIYLLTKKKRLYYMDGYGIIDTRHSSLVIYGFDTIGSKSFDIIYYHPRQKDR